MKILHFTFRGEHYQVNEDAQIKTKSNEYFSKDWLFIGGSKHHWSNRITVTMMDAFVNPELLNGCLGWDIDHGTTRQWGGRYNGKLPRISNAYVAESGVCPLCDAGFHPQEFIRRYKR